MNSQPPARHSHAAQRRVPQAALRGALRPGGVARLRAVPPRCRRGYGSAEPPSGLPAPLRPHATGAVPAARHPRRAPTEGRRALRSAAAAPSAPPARGGPRSLLSPRPAPGSPSRRRTHRSQLLSQKPPLPAGRSIQPGPGGQEAAGGSSSKPCGAAGAGGAAAEPPGRGSASPRAGCLLTATAEKSTEPPASPQAANAKARRNDMARAAAACLAPTHRPPRAAPRPAPDGAPSGATFTSAAPHGIAVPPPPPGSPVQSRAPCRRCPQSSCVPHGSEQRGCAGGRKRRSLAAGRGVPLNNRASLHGVPRGNHC